MIDDHRRFNRPNEIGYFDHPLARHMDRDMPIVGLYQSDHGPDFVEIRFPAEVGHEVEPCAAYSGGGEASENLPAGVRTNQGDAAIPTSAGFQRIEQRPMIECMSLTLHDNGPIDAKTIMQPAQLRLGCFVRRKAAVIG
jgi:hypothetical protein